jgi:hypothetical protein
MQTANQDCIAIACIVHASKKIMKTIVPAFYGVYSGISPPAAALHVNIIFSQL